MIGLGNPLVGPSAVDAVVAGCVYINPVYDQPVKEEYWSQHPYLEQQVTPFSVQNFAPTRTVRAPHSPPPPLGNTHTLAKKKNRE